MWALALTVVAALPPLTVAVRPDGEVKAPLAQVVLNDGQVVITPAGKRGFGAQRGTQLGATDTITVGVGAWVVLTILGNGHVVRLDDDLTLRIDQLAALKAPKQTQTLEQQLNKLVTVKEQDTATTRLIGWNAGQAGANVPQATKGSGGGSEKEESFRVPTKNAPKPPPPPPGNATATAPAPTPAPEPAPLTADAELKECVSKSVQGLGPDVVAALGDTLVLRVKLRDGATVVQLPNGLNTPACAVSWFFGRPGINAAWTDVPVKLK